MYVYESWPLRGNCGANAYDLWPPYLTLVVFFESQAHVRVFEREAYRSESSIFWVGGNAVGALLCTRHFNDTREAKVINVNAALPATWFIATRTGWLVFEYRHTPKHTKICMHWMCVCCILANAAKALNKHVMMFKTKELKRKVKGERVRHLKVVVSHFVDELRCNSEITVGKSLRV